MIPVHPNFKMFVLANRPGFPFLGNDLFRVTGDVFSCHVIANPDTSSLMGLMRRYGPDVPDHILKLLADAVQVRCNVAFTHEHTRSLRVCARVRSQHTHNKRWTRTPPSRT